MTRCHPRAVLLTFLLFGAGLLAPWHAPCAMDGVSDLVWPPPPQTPRIRYVMSIAKPEDIGRQKGWLRRFWEFIKGPEEEEMRKPMAVVADGRGRIYVADPAGKCVHVFDTAEGDYVAWREVGEKGLGFPIGLAVDWAGGVYIADSEHRRVYLLGREGELRGVFGGEELQRPTGVAVDDRRGRLYVVDTPQHDVKVYDLMDGKFVATLGSRGTQLGEFNYPSYIALDESGRLYITDGLNARVQLFSPEGEVYAGIGQHGDGSGDFSAPKGIGVDDEGHLYVADAAFDNIQVFGQDGRLRLYFGAAGQAAGQFWMPTGVYVDRRNRIYVADSYNKRVQIFQYVKEEGGP